MNRRELSDAADALELVLAELESTAEESAFLAGSVAALRHLSS